MRVRERQQKFPRQSFPERQPNMLSRGGWSGLFEGDKREADISSVQQFRGFMVKTKRGQNHSGTVKTQEQ